MKITIAAIALGSVAALGLAGCSSGSDDTAASASPSASESFNQKAPLTVNSGQFTSWPFTVEEGTIHCSGKAAWFRSGGKNYPLNSVARSEASSGTATVEKPQSSLDPIIKTPGAKDPVTGKTAAKADPYPIVQEAENMCGAV